MSDAPGPLLYVVDLPSFLPSATRILTNLKELITHKRLEGLRPTLMMDNNDDWLRSCNKTFQAFIKEMQLEDPLYNKFKDAGLTRTTYAHGSRWIDSIFVDSTILPASKCIWTLGLYQDIISDHVILYMNCNK